LAFYQGVRSQALEHLQEIVRQRAAKPDVYENDALELLLLIQASDDSLAMADLGRARLLDLQLKSEESLLLLQRALNRAQPGPLRDEIALAVAEQECKAGNYDQALSLYQQLSTDSSSLYQDTALQKMAHVYEDDLGQNDKARELYENLLEKFPESVFIEDVRKRIRQLENEP
jgi:tetratricopeptide (TPR) repeat protein